MIMKIWHEDEERRYEIDNIVYNKSEYYLSRIIHEEFICKNG